MRPAFIVGDKRRSRSSRYQNSGRRMPEGVLGPASVEFMGAPQARQSSSGCCVGWRVLRRGWVVEICRDDGGARSGLWVRGAVPRAKRREVESRSILWELLLFFGMLNYKHGFAISGDTCSSGEHAAWRLSERDLQPPVAGPSGGEAGAKAWQRPSRPLLSAPSYPQPT